MRSLTDLCIDLPVSHKAVIGETSVCKARNAMAEVVLQFNRERLSLRTSASVAQARQRELVEIYLCVLVHVHDEALVRFRSFWSCRRWSACQMMQFERSETCAGSRVFAQHGPDVERILFLFQQFVVAAPTFEDICASLVTGGDSRIL